MFKFFKQKEIKKDDSSFFTAESNGKIIYNYDAIAMQSIQKQATAYEASTGDSALGSAYTQSFDFAVNPIVFNWYASNAFIGFQTMAIMAQNGFISKACAIPAKDAVRKGWEVVCLEDKEIDTAIFSRIKELDKKFKIKQKLINQSYFTKVFGIRVALFEVQSTDPLYYEKPFNIDGVKKGAYKGIKQIDPYWITPAPTGEDLTDPTNQNFYEPSFWYVNGKKIHASHLIITKGEEVADVLKPTFQYAGLSLTQKVYQRLYACEKIADEAPKLTQSKRLNIYKIKNIAKAMANFQKFKDKMNEWVGLRDNYGIKFADSEDEITQIDTSLADLDVNIMTQFQLFCSLVNVPSYKLLNAPMKGFSSGETEQESYYEYLENIQDYEMTPLLDRHYQLLMKAYVIPEFAKDFNATIKWNELKPVSEQERATINLNKAQTDTAYANAGIIDSETVLKRLIEDETSDYYGMKIEAEEYNLSEYDTQDVIKQEEGKYYVYSQSGEKLSEGYGTEEEAKKRLKEIEYFKATNA